MEKNYNMEAAVFLLEFMEKKEHKIVAAKGRDNNPGAQCATHLPGD